MNIQVVTPEVHKSQGFGWLFCMVVHYVFSIAIQPPASLQLASTMLYCKNYC
jgi:hypothetical protein